MTRTCELQSISDDELLRRLSKLLRQSRQYPVRLEMLADGRLHLSGIAKLAPHLTETNRESLLARAAYKSKREIEELLAELSPRPDVPPGIRKLPRRPTKTRLATAGRELGT